MRRIPRPRLRLRTGPLFLASAATVPAYLLLNSDSLPSPPTEVPLGALVRSYIVYTLCSIPALVDHSPKILDAVASVPGLRQVAFGLVKVTFFDQFVGGETANATLPLLRALRAANKGAIFAYSVEVDEHEARGSGGAKGSASTPTGPPPHKRIVEEILRSIDVAADFEDSLRGSSRATVPYHSLITGSSSNKPPLPPDADNSRGMWVAIKLTAMLPSAHALINFSKYITSAREETKSRHRDPNSEATEIALDRLLDISSGKEPVQPECIPFPGTPLPLDMNIIHSLGQKTRDNDATMTPQDIQDIYELYTDLIRICERAQDRGVRLLMDAEYSWYQPAIDSLTLSLMRRFNALPSSPSEPDHLRPLVYATYQAYLRRTPLYLAHTIHDAQENGYALGVKLVRGAYHLCETEGHRGPLSISPESQPPVWSTKEETDRSYNSCVQLAVHAIKEDIEKSAVSSSVAEVPTPEPRTLYGRLRSAVVGSPPSSSSVPPKHSPGQVGIGLLFGTHNWDSCNLILDQIRQAGLGRIVTVKEADGKEVEKIELSPEVTERVAIGQLYGMCDDLTDSVVNQTISASPIAVKYLPYGAMKEVLPYLSRRAIENKSVLGNGGAAKERQRAGKEIRRRVGGWFGVGVR